MAFNPGIIAAPLDTRLPDTIVADALAALQARRPEWVARNASPEVVFLEALALAASDVMDTADDVIGALAEGVLATLYGIPRLPGAAGVGQITLDFDSNVTTTIPAGTRFLLAEYGIEVSTTAAVSVTADDQAVLQVATTTATSSLNGVATATVDLLDAIPNALSATVTAAFANGADPEDDDAYIARAGQRLNRISNSLVVADHFSAYCLESGLCSNAKTISAWDGASTSTIGSDAGKVTVVVYGKGGTVSASDKTTLAAQMQAITYAGATVAVKDVAVTTVNVTASVTASPGFSATEVQNAATAALQKYLNPETWVVGADVTNAALVAVMVEAPEIFSATVSAPSGTTTIAENAVAKYGTLTVSVV